MRKIDEINNPNSCWNRAKPNEMVFVLLGRDIAAPRAIYAWIQERIRRRKNLITDPQLLEAEKCAEIMRAENAAAIHQEIKKQWPHKTTVGEVCEIVRTIMQVDVVSVEIEQWTSGKYEVFFWINGKDSPDAVRWNPQFELPLEYANTASFGAAVARASMDLVSLIGFICDHIQSMTTSKAIRERDLGALYELAWEIVQSKKMPATAG